MTSETSSLYDLQISHPNEEKFRTIVESVPNGIIMVDVTGNIVISNSEAEKMFLYEKNELIGQKVEVLVRSRTVHPNLREQFLMAPQKRQMGAGRDLMGQRKDGSEVPVEIGLNPIRLGDHTFVLATIVDITERKRVEAKLKRAYEEVQQKNVEMEQFVYTVSHDLKAPLVTSISFLGFLREDLQENKMDEVMDSLDRLEKAHKRMQGLINDLLELSRVGRMGLQLETLDLREELEIIVDDFSDRLAAKYIKVEISPDMPTILGDRKRVHQVFENLINNAIKYGATTAHPRIEVSWKDAGTETLICVRDFGAGIDRQFHQKIFGLFQRLHADSEGTGVGLAIVSRIMQFHGGRAWVESEPGQGSQFWVAFPKMMAQVDTRRIGS